MAFLLYFNTKITGFNCTIFAYGQTGSGKSFTMFGPDIGSEKLAGIIPRACSQIFRHIESDESGTEYTIRVSFLEIYREQVKVSSQSKVCCVGLSFSYFDLVFFF